MEKKFIKIRNLEYRLIEGETENGLLTNEQFNFNATGFPLEKE